MGLVDHHQVPLRPEQVRPHVVLLGEVERGDDPVVLLPGVAPQPPAHLPGLHHHELLVEAVQELVLPLRGERRRHHHQDPVHHPAQLQLLDQEPGHDGLAGPGVVGQHEAQPGLGEQAPVDRLDLVGQPTHPAQRDREQGVVGVGQLDAVRLHPAEEAPGIGDGGAGDGGGQGRLQIGGGEHRLGRAAVGPADPEQVVLLADGLDVLDPDRGREVARDGELTVPGPGGEVGGGGVRDQARRALYCAQH